MRGPGGGSRRRPGGGGASTTGGGGAAGAFDAAALAVVEADLADTGEGRTAPMGGGGAKASRRRRCSGVVSPGSAAAGALILVLVLFFAANHRSDGDYRPRPTSTPRPPPAPMGAIVYGTARMGGRTAPLVAEAVRAGFLHVATAGRHGKHNETGAGAGWTTAAEELNLAREDLYLQTMFVPAGSPDFDRRGTQRAGGGGDGVGGGEASVEEQVRSSVRASLANLRTTYLDAVLYHNVKNRLDPIETVLAAWRTLEGYVDDGTVRHLGITNCHDVDFLTELHERVRIKPAIVQNRFHANRQFGVHYRPFLRRHGIAEQAFWTLTGNGGTLRGDAAQSLAAKRGLTPQQFMFAFLLSLGVSPMIGTTSRVHMDQDLEVARRYEAEGAGAFSLGAPPEGANADMESFARALGKPDLVA